MPHHLCACRPAAPALFALTCLAALLGFPAPAAAQRDAFIDATIAFRLSLAGTPGDRGAQLLAHLDEMATSLAIWDRALELSELDLRSALLEAPGERAIDVHIRLASLFADRRRLDDALAELDAAIALDRTSPSPLIFRGLVHEAAGAPHHALENFRQAWALEPQDPVTAYLVLDREDGEARDDAARLMDALLDAFRVVRERPLSFIDLALIPDSMADWTVFAPAAYAEGFRLFADGRYVEAIESFRTAAAQDPLLIDPAARDARLALGIANVHAFQYGAAIEQFEAAAAAVPESSEARRLLGLAYVANSRDAESLPHFEAAVRLSPGDERPRMALARALIRLERWTDAEAVLRDTIDALPASGEARWLMADVYEQQERWMDAIQALEDATALPVLAGRGPLYWRIADSWHRQQSFDQVTRWLSAHARADPNSVLVRRELGQTYIRLGVHDRALRELVMADLLGADDASALTAIGQIHLGRGRPAMAEAPLQRAVRLDPNHAEARYVLGTALVRLGRDGDGAEHLAVFKRLREEEREQMQRSFRVETLMPQAENHESQGRYDLAASAWREITTLEPDDPVHRIALARTLARAGDPQAAVVELERAAVMDGAPAEVHLELAALYAQLGRVEDSDRARTAYERIRPGAASAEPGSRP